MHGSRHLLRQQRTDDELTDQGMSAVLANPAHMAVGHFTMAFAMKHCNLTVDRLVAWQVRLALNAESVLVNTLTRVPSSVLER